MHLATVSYMQVVWNIKHKEWPLTGFITQMKHKALQVDDNNNGIRDKSDEKENAKKFENYAPRWRKKALPKPYSSLGEEFSIPPNNIDTLTPYPFDTFICFGSIILMYS